MLVHWVATLAFVPWPRTLHAHMLEPGLQFLAMLKNYHSQARKLSKIELRSSSVASYGMLPTLLALRDQIQTGLIPTKPRTATLNSEP